MNRFYQILNSVNESIVKAAGERFGGKKRSELKNSDFLFPATKSFPIVTPADVPDAISNFGRMKGQMSYESFLRKLYNKCKSKGPEFVAALPDASKEQLGLNKKKVKAELDIEDEGSSEYKQEFLEMSIASIRAISAHANHILAGLDDPEKMDSIKENLTESWLQGKIAVMQDYMTTIHDFVMFSRESDDESSTEAVKKKLKKNINNYSTYQPNNEDQNYNDMNNMGQPVDYFSVTSDQNKPGLWENIRRKKERMGKNYKPAKPGDKDRPDPDQWNKLTKKDK